MWATADFVCDTDYVPPTCGTYYDAVYVCDFVFVTDHGPSSCQISYGIYICDFADFNCEPCDNDHCEIRLDYSKSYKVILYLLDLNLIPLIGRDFD